MRDSYEVFDLMAASHQMVRSWVVCLMESGNTSRTVNRKLSSLKSFYKYLVRQGKIEVNPMTKIVSPKMSKRLPEFIEKSKMELLFIEGAYEDDFSSCRDRLIIELLYGTGIRLSELIGLKHADTSEDSIKVTGKRNKERVIPVSYSITELINKYKGFKGGLEVPNEEYLLVTDSGNKLYEKFVYRKVNRYLGNVTTARKKSPHVLRHTFATHMLNNGADLNAIKELLGHANLSATQVYTHNTIEKLKSVYTQAHPRAQKK